MRNTQEVLALLDRALRVDCWEAAAMRWSPPERDHDREEDRPWAGDGG